MAEEKENAKQSSEQSSAFRVSEALNVQLAGKSTSLMDLPDFSSISKMAVEEGPEEEFSPWWKRWSKKKTQKQKNLEQEPKLGAPKSDPALSTGLEQHWANSEQVDTTEHAEVVSPEAPDVLDEQPGQPPRRIPGEEHANQKLEMPDGQESEQEVSQVLEHSAAFSLSPLPIDTGKFEPGNEPEIAEQTELEDTSKGPTDPPTTAVETPGEVKITDKKKTEETEAAFDEIGSEKPSLPELPLPEPTPVPVKEFTLNEPALDKLKGETDALHTFPDGVALSEPPKATEEANKATEEITADEEGTSRSNRSGILSTALIVLILLLLAALPWLELLLPGWIVTSEERLAALALALCGVALVLYLRLLYSTDDAARGEPGKAELELIINGETSQPEAPTQMQDAVLRLMNELDEVAKGDLTVEATVTDDNIGTIADFINYTVEEFRAVILRINEAAVKVDAATQSTHQTSSELLNAAQGQAEKIREAGRAALEVARRMNEASGEAKRTAQAAELSKVAAEQGARATEDSVRGMDEIRDTIQETAKRIKRLGESSLEIGEIVEIITGITEQTNVLALNAAIQAANAGEAGRGFSVVAEEVQRLAEHSGNATRRIAGLVKSIQADTRGAVEAMENSTRNVVEGSKKTRAAGESLSQIREVSQNMSSLIASIALLTQTQSQAASNVAKRMQDIYRITGQTTEGTRRTDAAVEELARLSTNLKSSVARFRTN